jgi:hypothetical protein
VSNFSTSATLLTLRPHRAIRLHGNYAGLTPPSPATLLLLTPYQHYLWASGHFLLLLSSLRYILAWATLKSVSAWWYKGPLLSPLSLVPSLDIPFCRITASFTGALISYAIVCQCVVVFLLLFSPLNLLRSRKSLGVRFLDYGVDIT